jgi:NhaP-type Na+/H+ or K+/H+ antiporter
MDLALTAVVALVTIVAVSAFSSRLGVAAPLVLVVVGVVYSFIPGVPSIDIPPEWILAGVLPPLLYSAAVNVPLVDFRRNLKAITGLSVLLVVVTALGVGLLLFWLLPDLNLAAAIALGAVISPTDAVAATSIGKKLGLPPRLVTVLEGEGLVNDASALVLLRSAIAATAGAVSLWGVVGDFFYAVAVALVVGLIVGLVTVFVRSKLKDSVLTTAISFAVPFIAYLPAEELNASGVLAVVVAGLVTGHQSARYFSAQDRISERLNWRTLQFVLENGVFLLMGAELSTLIASVDDNVLSVERTLVLALLVTAVLIVLRFLFVVPLIAMLRREGRRAARESGRFEAARRRFDAMPDDAIEPRRRSRAALFFTRRAADLDFLKSEGLGWRGGAVLAWSGMRGVVTLAAAQSLPAETPYRPQLILLAFFIAVITLLLQGGTLPAVIRLLGVRGSDEQADRQEYASLIQDMSSVGVEALKNPDLKRADGGDYDPEVVDRVRGDSESRSAAASEVMDASSDIGPHEQYRELRRIVLDAERAALLDARSAGSYSSRTLARAQQLLDIEESRFDQATHD